MSDILKLENKSIVITDPCYLNDTLKGKIRKEDFEWYSDGGVKTSMYKMGIENYIAVPTLYGDWSCTAYNIGIFDIRDYKNVSELSKFFQKNVSDKDKIGNFCADSGMVCVVLADELRNFNIDFFEWALCHKHCATYIPNYTGEIGIYDVKDEGSKYNTVYRHIYGIGEGLYGCKNFCTAQTGY